MPDNVVIIGAAVAVVLVVAAIVLVVALRRRSRARYSEPVVRRIDLAAPAPMLGASATPEVDAAPETVAVPVIPPRAQTPVAPILHFDTVELEAFPRVASEPESDETIVTRARSTEPPAGPETDATVLSRRRRAFWQLETQHGQRVHLPLSQCIVGRRPHPLATHPSAALVTIDDPEKTVSATHALFELIDDAWMVTDLDSTNGVIVVEGGFETAIPVRTRTRIVGDFFLGDLAVRFLRES